MIQLFLTFLKIGFLGFGGGYAMLSLIYENSLHLGISATQFADLNALDLLAPGPIAVNSATYVGFITFGIIGAIIATIAVCMSSFVFSYLLFTYEDTLLSMPLFNTFLHYTKIAAIAMILSVALSLVNNAYTSDGQPLLITLTLVSNAYLRLYRKKPILFCMACTAGIGALYGLFL